MTIIVLRSGVMAADTGTFCDGTLRMLTRKIARAQNGALGAACGQAPYTAKFRAWLAGGMTDDLGISCEDSEFGALIAHPDGKVERIDCHGLHWEQDPDTPFHIEGVAGDLALGALLMGATAEEAVGICVEHYAYCAGPIQVERLIRSDAPVLAHAGEILTCENDHPLYRLRADIGPVNPSDHSPFEPVDPSIAEQVPPALTPDCPTCGAQWVRSGPAGLSFKVEGRGWVAA